MGRGPARGGARYAGPPCAHRGERGTGAVGAVRESWPPCWGWSWPRVSASGPSEREGRGWGSRDGAQGALGHLCGVPIPEAPAPWCCWQSRAGALSAQPYWGCPKSPFCHKAWAGMGSACAAQSLGTLQHLACTGAAPRRGGARSEACCGAGLSRGRTPCGSPARQGGPAMPGENTAPLGPQGASTAPSHPVPTCRWQLPAALPAPGTLPALPACACVTWLGMNIAKHSGSAPVRSRCGERHTRPCALSRGGPGRRRGVAQPRSGRLGTGTQEPREQPPSCHPAVPTAAPGWHRRGRGLGQGDAKSATAEEPNRGPVRAGVWSINK